MYNFTTASASEAKIKFDLNRYRRAKVENAIFSGRKEAEMIIRYFKSVEDSSPDKHNDTSMSINMYNWLLRSWQFDIEEDEAKLIKIIGQKMTFSLNKAYGGPKHLSEDRIGEDVNIEHISSAYNQPDDIDRLERNFKHLLTGLKRMADAVDKRNMSGCCIKTAYTSWLHIIKDPRTQFIDPLTPNNEYTTKKGPNKIIDSYTKSGGVAVEDRIEESLTAYIGARLKKVSVGQNMTDFMMDLYFLFKLCLNQPILAPEDGVKMNKDMVDSEIREMEKRFPDEKFTEEFIRKTATLEDWARYSPDDLKNEFGIKPMEFELAPLELPTLEKVFIGRYVETSAERETLGLAFSNSVTKRGEEAELFRNVYSNRLTVLERSEETYPIKKQAQDNEMQITPTQLTTSWKQDMNFGRDLNNRLEKFKSEYSGKVDVETRKHIDSLIEYHIEGIVNKLLSDYRRNDWSMRILEEENPEMILKAEVASTLKEKEGMLTIMKQEINIANVRLSLESWGGKPDTPKSLTPDYFIVTPELIIVPKVKKIDGSLQLTVGGIERRYQS